MLCVTPTQKSQIFYLQNDSFLEYCQLHGYEPEEHASFLFSIVKDRFKESLGDVAASDIPDERLAKYIKAMSEAGTFFDFLEAERELRRVDYADLLVSNAATLPISFDYITPLCERLKLSKATADRPESIRDLVTSIPMLSSWEMEFNAFVEGGTLVDGIPCICIYEALRTSCDSFIDWVAPAAIEFGDRTKERSKEAARAIGESDQFQQNLRNCLGVVLGETNYCNRAQIANRTTYLTIQCMVEGSMQMVWFHEFGHLLQGHLEKRPSHQIEFEADLFAFKVLAGQRSEFAPSIDIFTALGGLTALALIDVIERVEGISEGTSHPSGERRVMSVLEFWAANQRVHRAASGYLRSLAAVCSPTLEKHWGVSIDYDLNGD